MPPRTATRTPSEEILDSRESSLLDVVDNLLNQGVVLTGDLTLGLAQIDLVYARLSLLLCAADRLLPADDSAGPKKRARRT